MPQLSPSTSTPPQTPRTPPQYQPPHQFQPTTTPAPAPQPTPSLVNATNVIASHRYKITLSSTGVILSWGEAGAAVAKVPSTYKNFRVIFADQHTLIYILDALTSHVEPNATFLIGAIHVPLGIVVVDLGPTSNYGP
jgi:hypothetical protein